MKSKVVSTIFMSLSYTKLVYILSLLNKQKSYFDNIVAIELANDGFSATINTVFIFYLKTLVLFFLKYIFICDHRPKSDTNIINLILNKTFNFVKRYQIISGTLSRSYRI